MNAKSEIRCLEPESACPKFEKGFEPYITKLTVAERMDVEIRTVTRYMRRGVLRHYKFGPMVRFKWSEVERDLREHFQVAFEPRAAGAGNPKSDPPPPSFRLRRTSAGQVGAARIRNPREAA
jgi:excisionase family DNA binding protein